MIEGTERVVEGARVLLLKNEGALACVSQSREHSPERAGFDLDRKTMHRSSLFVARLEAHIE